MSSLSQQVELTSAGEHARLRLVVDHARSAPSIHNTQPWAWHVVGTGLELWADRTRQLPTTDPEGRNLVMSCGAALHHAVVAAGALGLRTEVTYLPGPGRSDRLAHLRFVPTEVPEDADLSLGAIAARCTDRRRFTSWPVPPEVLEDLAALAGPWGVDAVPVSDAALRFRLELLIEEALRAQLHDATVLGEERDWVRRGGAAGSTDGVPLGAVPPLSGSSGERRSRFAAQVVAEPPTRRLGESTDGLLLLSTPGDDPIDWLRTGEALSALWLRATVIGLSLVPLSQPVEVAQTRRSLDDLVLHGHGHAQLMARVGWQEIGRHSLVRTPRRSLDDVLAGPGGSRSDRDQCLPDQVTAGPARRGGARED